MYVCVCVCTCARERRRWGERRDTASGGRSARGKKKEEKRAREGKLSSGKLARSGGDESQMTWMMDESSTPDGAQKIGGERVLCVCAVCVRVRQSSGDLYETANWPPNELQRSIVILIRNVPCVDQPFRRLALLARG